MKCASSLREPVDLAAVAQAACDDARALAPDRTITLETGARAPRSSAIREQLRQVLSNLLGNALRHSSREPRSRSRWRPTTVGHPERARSRTGPRAGAEEQVFERFWREKAGQGDGAGSGLGLAIVAAIAKAHGGRVEAANAGGGAEFTVTLPSRAAVEQPAPA